MTPCFVRVALDHPLPALYDYRYPLDAPAPQPGMLVRVPFGRRETVGLICEVSAHTDVPTNKLRDVSAVCADLPPLSAQWLALAGFAADYYQRGLGEVALPALPQALRDPARWPRLLAPEERYRLLPVGRDALPDALPARAQALRRLAQALVDAGELDLADARALHPKAAATLESWREAGWVEYECVAFGAAGPSSASNGDERLADGTGSTGAMEGAAPLHLLSDEQAVAVEAILEARGFAPFLLHGVTGSGKTEVYLRALSGLLEREPDAQALVLVPEINLTPQFEAAFRTRFAGVLPDDAIVTLHSGLAEGERAHHWLAAHTGRARIVLGTRLAVLASLPRLAMLVVDEEHDPAYQQQEGLRYSARDLAVWRAKQLGVPVVLGSATPSLESWWQAEQGRYTRLTLSRRAIADAVLPSVKLIDLEEERRRGRASFEGLSGPLVAA
ncbi:MAG: DEAD/DEAH box helicase, partial [Paraburkholderia sp.]|nr:DEAD/DEAH box helicase [Paraburkholderia sp.]